MPDLPLAVPVQLDALVVNQDVLARDTFRWWQFNYLSLSHWKSPEPLALDGSVGGQREGVYLSWTLPDALRHSPADSPDGLYPLVPNRWLIVRLSGVGRRRASAWVLESDCPYTPAVTTSDSADASMYLADPELVDAWRSCPDPIRRAVTIRDPVVPVVKLGVSFPLSEWSERAAQPMFLSAVAPSNPLFSSYVAHNLGVFSFYDPLTDIDEDTLSYFVLGWYSDPARDILAPAGSDGTAYAELLRRLGWTTADGSASPTNRSVYHGAAFSVPWNRAGSAPAGDPLQAIRDSGELNVAVGNTTVDAFTALVAPRLPDPAEAHLLRALQYDLLPQLNEINGEALLEERIRKEWFASKPGGYSWTIVDKASIDKASDRKTPDGKTPDGKTPDGKTPDGEAPDGEAPDGSTGSALTPAEQLWLSRLNQAQAQLDEALSTLHSLQWQLHALWLKNGYLSDETNVFFEPPSGVEDLSGFQSQLADALDPGLAGSLAARLVDQFGVVQQLASQVPQPAPGGTDDAQRAWQDGITAFAEAEGLDPAKKLKAVSAPRYWQAANPVVVLSGVQPPPSAARISALPVRPGETLITGFTLGSGVGSIGADAVAGLLALVGPLSAVPTSAATPLLQEFLLLDPDNAPAIATATGQPQAELAAVMTAHDQASYTGSLPAICLTGWQQPWSPMFLEWTGTYSPFSFTAGDTPAWTFDGTDYRLVTTDSEQADEQRRIGGISLLSPHPGVVLSSRLQAFVQQYGTATELARIGERISGSEGWKFLAQELTGFHQMLSLRDDRAFRRPTAADHLGDHPVAALTGYGDGVIPPRLALLPAGQGRVDTVPLLQGPALPFHGTRQGGFSFTDFQLYDKFGRILHVIESGESSGLFDARNFPVRIAPELVPEQVLEPGVKSVLQLPPRVLQPARLDVRLLDALDDAKVYQQDPDVMPISGWVLPNHLDGGIQVFAQDGTALGEFRLYAQADGSRLGRWTAPPHSSLILDDLRTLAPHLHAILASPRLATEAGFQAFLAVIDETLWTTDSLGDRADANLSVLVGRPLALLRTRLQFQLDGDPFRDPGWAATFTQRTPDFLTQDFAIRLGDHATRQDGVIGYFTGSDYDVFNSTAAPPEAPAQDYVQVIGPVGGTAPGNYLQLSFAPQTYRYLTVLADPRAAMHAYTGILPVRQCDIPQQFVDDALAAMEITFQLGPILTTLGPAPSEGAAPPARPQAIVYPTPVEQNGSWSWWEPDITSGHWTGHGLVRASPTATSSPTPNTLREGCLQFSADLGDQPHRPAG